MVLLILKTLILNRVVKMTTTVKADTRILEYAVETFRASLNS